MELIFGATSSAAVAAVEGETDTSHTLVITTATSGVTAANGGEPPATGIPLVGGVAAGIALAALIITTLIKKFKK